MLGCIFLQSLYISNFVHLFFFWSSNQVNSLSRILNSYTAASSRQIIFARAPIPQHNHFVHDCVHHKWTKVAPSCRSPLSEKRKFWPNFIIRFQYTKFLPRHYFITGHQAQCTHCKIHEKLSLVQSKIVWSNFARRPKTLFYGVSCAARLGYWEFDEGPNKPEWREYKRFQANIFFFVWR